MFRKITAITALVLYSLSAVGMPLHMHYCKGQLQHITFLAQMQCDSHEMEEVSPFACCMGGESKGCDSEKESNDCCSDQSEWLQLDADALVFVIAGDDSDGYDWQLVAVEHDEIVTEQVVHSQLYSDPPEPDIPRYLAHCALVYYG